MMSKRNREKRAEPRPPPSLQDAMEQALGMTQAAEKGEENRMPMLYMWKTDGSLTICGLAVDGGGPQFACAARLMVLQEEPAVAVVAVEGWDADIPDKPLEELDPHLRDWILRREAGEHLGIVDLPPDCRGESLNLFGEDAAGQVADRIYKIRPRLGEGAKRRFERREMSTVESRFHPLFVLSWARREGIPEEIATLGLRREAEQVGLWPRESG